MNLGCHLSVGNGYLEMGLVAKSIGADTFQFFTRNPRGGGAKPLDVEDMTALSLFMAEHGFGKIVAHAPFTVNLAAADESKREFAISVLEDDLMRMQYVPGNYYNIHPGSHTGQGADVGIAHIARGINRVLKPQMETMLLLETMAGKGSEVGCTFEEIRAIYDAVELKEKVGVCLDTCHLFVGGYDLLGDLDGVLSEFDRIIGLDKLKAVHLNDSMYGLGSKKDRHEKIGKGLIGFEGLVKIITHEKLKHLPFVLETPNDVDGYAEEIALLRGAL